MKGVNEYLQKVDGNFYCFSSKNLKNKILLDSVNEEGFPVKFMFPGSQAVYEFQFVGPEEYSCIHPDGRIQPFDNYYWIDDLKE